MKLTPWFPGTVKPVRDGVYQRTLPNGAVNYARFCKGEWFCSFAKQYSAQRTNMFSLYTTLPWRGVAKK